MKLRATGLLAISVTLALLSLPPALAAAGSIHARFDLNSLQGSPFPSNRFTVADSTQNTGVQVRLPKQDCAPSDCLDIDVLNELDGFSLSPRISIPFDGPIDEGSVSSQSVFLVSLGSTLPGEDPGGEIVGINEVVRDTFTNTLSVESNDQLDQHTRYILVVTQSVRDQSGKHVKAAKEFLDLVNNVDGGSTGDPALDGYRTSLRNALTQIDGAGIVPLDQVVAASLFTTQSVTAVLEKIRDQIKAATPDPADFLLGPGGSRTVFDRSTVTDIRWKRQQKVDPGAPQAFSEIPLNISVPLDVVPGAVGTIAFGRYSAPDYRVHSRDRDHPGEFIPAVGTRTGTPLVQGTDDITFVLYLPSSPKPAGGYPVAISGHGGVENKTASQLTAAKLAEEGIATIAIDGPGYGFGPLSTYSVLFTDSSPMTFLSGGRGFDQNFDGLIAVGEGFRAAAPRDALDISGRDGHRQWAADHMQLVREIEVGMDVDGDAAPDLDPSRIYYLGHSGGGRQGAIFLAVEPSVRAGVLSVPNGSMVERLSAQRGGFAPALQSRILINSPGITSVNGIAVPAPYFDENLPLRNGTPFTVRLDGTSREVKSPVINTVPGATKIQQVLDYIEWASESASSVAFAPHLRRDPLNGVPAKSVIIQFAYGDRLVPNPSTTALLRAGNLADRATFLRTDLRFPVNPFPGLNLYPHVFMDVAITSPNSDVKEIAVRAQRQIATFFASDGTEVIDPDDVRPVLSVPIFEVPVVLPLPEALNYYP
jgi:Bacterial virulence factor lipase N-terminal